MITDAYFSTSTGLTLIPGCQLVRAPCQQRACVTEGKAFDAFENSADDASRCEHPVSGALMLQEQKAYDAHNKPHRWRAVLVTASALSPGDPRHCECPVSR